MEIAWLGHSCFRLKGREASVITDPFTKELGYPLGRLTANIVTVSHPHPQHSFTAAIAGQPKVVDRPGEYEIANVFINGIRTFHDAEGGRARGQNNVFLVEIDGVRVCHLGDLGHIPSPAQIEEISVVDVLLVPVGGVSTIDAAAAAEVVNLLEPRVVIPMHCKTAVAGPQLQPVERFLQEMGLKDLEPQPRLSLSRTSLPAEARVVLLDYRR